MAATLRLAVPLMAITLAACISTSPEAARARGGGAGADPGNKRAVAEIHAGSEVYYKTPCRLPVDCRRPGGS